MHTWKWLNALASVSYFPPKPPSPPHTWYLPPWWRYPGAGSVYKWGCFNLNAHLFDTLYFVQSIVMIITISVFAISKGNPSFITPKTLQCVLQSKTLVLLAARKTKLLLKFWMDYIAKKARKERSLNNHWKAVTHFSFFAISENSVMANQEISLHRTINRLFTSRLHLL